jgi:CDP-diacylglycerol--glycerol-3-phosphate 3-phosphatidyltransferase
MRLSLSWQSIPNLITLFRVIVIPLLVACLSTSSPRLHRFALALFLFAAFTDFLDGMIARRWKVVSEFGKLLDPLADKILVMTALVMLITVRVEGSNETMVPGWLVVIILAREFWVTGLRSAASARGLVIAASDSAKAKTVIQMVGISFLIVGSHTLQVSDYILTYRTFGLNLLLLSLYFSLVSAIQYTSEVINLYLHSSERSSTSI